MHLVYFRKYSNKIFCELTYILNPVRKGNEDSVCKYFSSVAFRNIYIQEVHLHNTIY